MAARFGTITFRPRVDVEGDFETIDAWAQEYRMSFNAVINSFLPAIAYALKNKLFVDEKTGDIYVLADFGHIKLVTGRETKPRTELLS